MIKIILVLVFISVAIHCETTDTPDCSSAGLRRFDSNIAKLVAIGNSGRKFPENKGPELKKFCNQSIVYINEIDSYKGRCMPETTKQVANVMVYAVKNTIKQLCKKESKRLDEIIDATPCANTGQAEIQKCYTKMIDNMLGIQHADDKHKVGMLCCEYHKLFPCFESRLSRLKICTTIRREVLADFVKSTVGNTIDAFCADFTEASDKCSKLEKPPKKKKNQRRTKSFALPMLDVLMSMPES